MEHAKALAIAKKRIQDFVPYCERSEIAGSLRRGAANVGDIEIVIVPIPSRDLFGDPAQEVCSLDLAVHAMLENGHLGMMLKNGPRYKQFALPQGIKLDLFIVRPPAQWGVIFTIRTGPANFSRWCVTQRNLGGALPSHCRIRNGAVLCGSTENSTTISTPEEIDFLNFIGLGWLEPTSRQLKAVKQTFRG